MIHTKAQGFREPCFTAVTRLSKNCCRKVSNARTVYSLSRARPVGEAGRDSFVACLGHLIIGHASLSGRSIVPTPIKDTSTVWALNTFSPRNSFKKMFILSSSCFAVCGHHLSPKIAIVSLLLSGVFHDGNAYPTLVGAVTRAAARRHVRAALRVLAL